jgi:hypothetical protein
VQSYANVLHTYMEALGRSDYATIVGLFAPEGTVRSPFLGEMPAELFFDRLGQASETNFITPIDVFLSEGRYDARRRVLPVRLDGQRRISDHLQGDGLVLIRTR